MEKKHICAGLLAHVDAGKTTLSEGLLYLAGSIRRLGRVDNRDACLDNYELERERGITIFSKQAELVYRDMQMTLLDTPGHVDFSAEMERTLQVLDYAVLVISGADGVQGHTETLWRLLKRYRIPVFLFVNKMDQEGTSREMLLAQLRSRLSEACLDFTAEWDGDWWENLAVCDENALETYLEQGTVEEDEIRRMIGERKVFPCYFGSALKLQGVEELLEGLEHLTRPASYEETFGAKVYKISRDEQGNRLTHMKITGGVLRTRELLSGVEEEKVNQIRIYSGGKYETVNEATAGTICAVTGPATTYPGQGIGSEQESELPVLEPVLTYRLELPEGCNVQEMLKNLRKLEEEEPQLHITWNETLGELHAQVMGEVQIEVLKRLISDRFGIEVEFGTGRIVYKETILTPAEGVGHFEPLRHYAEVHLLLEPAEAGSGIQISSRCSEDMLDRNWQRLILTHLEEKQHRGVLTGSEITDMHITLVAGRAHQKHTEGGDFRQATYRAVRQGLMEAQCRLLEPYYAFRLEVPAEQVGRAMMDLERMQGSFEAPIQEAGTMILTGSAPVACMQDYQREVIAYTRGRGSLTCSLKGYYPCHNEQEVVDAMAYDPEADLDNPCGSVFCAHGAGFVVPWYEVKQYMQVESPLKAAWKNADQDLESMEAGNVGARGAALGESFGNAATGGSSRRAAGGGLPFGATEKELEAIFTRTYGEQKRRLPSDQGPRQVKYQGSSVGEAGAGKTGSGAAGADFGKAGRGLAGTGFDKSDSRPEPSMGKPGYMKKSREGEESYLLVDGYNMIHAWEELRELMSVTVDGARHRLMDILCNYQAYVGCHLIVVFDAYKVSGGLGSAQDYHNIHVVYTKEAETADQYIEKVAHQMGRKYRVTVATSDGLEQLIIRGQGCLLMSANDLREDIARVGQQIEEDRGILPKPGKNYLFDAAEADLEELMKKIGAV